MAKVSIYLPDDLETEVRSAGLEISAICQDALRAALPEADDDNALHLSLRRVESALRTHKRVVDGTKVVAPKKKAVAKRRPARRPTAKE